MLETLIPIAVAFAGGSAFAKIVEVVADNWKGSAGRRRSEVDRIAKHLSDARRRERIATEWGHRNAVLAIRAGVPEKEMPVLDFKD